MSLSVEPNLLMSEPLSKAENTDFTHFFRSPLYCQMFIEVANVFGGKTKLKLKFNINLFFVKFYFSIKTAEQSLRQNQSAY